MLNKNRAFIITGAGKGLGRAFALRLAGDGGAVIVNNRLRDGQPDSASAVVAEIEEAGGRAVVNHLDVRAPEAPDQLVSEALRHFGRLDGVVLNAGVNGDAARFENSPPEAFEEVMATNFVAPMKLAHAAWPHLANADAGRLLFVSSTAGLYGVRGRAPYAASKGALNAFAATLADEGGKAGIGVNILMPYAATQMTAGAGSEAVNAMLAADAVAPLASWLASAECDTTGEIWISGAGYVCKARVLETQGTKLEGGVAQLLKERGVLLGDFVNGVGVMGAEKAFAAFLARASGQRQDAD